MRRSKPISVKVRAPSRGLVSRLPGESADLLPSRGDVSIPSTLLTLGSSQRAASRASNVRYDNGVVRTAPGYSSILLQSSILEGVIAYWSMDEASGTRNDGSGNGNNLTEQDGTDDTVGVTTGKFNGAALFASIPFFVFVEDSVKFSPALDPRSFISVRTMYTGDLMAMSAGLGASFQSPTIVTGIDRPSITPSLLSGVYLSATVTSTTIADGISISSGILSGAYTLTIVPGGTSSDAAATSMGLLSGAYTLVVVSENAGSDAAQTSMGLLSGAYTQTVFLVENESDAMALTAGLSSGSYS